MDNEEIKEISIDLANKIMNLFYDEIDHETISDIIFHKLHEKFNKEKYPGL